MTTTTFTTKTLRALASALHPRRDDARTDNRDLVRRTNEAFLLAHATRPRVI
ncbi:MAG: hypothetical protein IPL94_01030 [Tetrasphaera sp.]|jgi:hypothetical protein|nr:hypothetical protein [Tetrasphaera sp.]